MQHRKQNQGQLDGSDIPIKSTLDWAQEDYSAGQAPSCLRAGVRELTLRGCSAAGEAVDEGLWAHGHLGKLLKATKSLALFRCPAQRPQV